MTTAFTEAQRVQIRFSLGLADVFQQNDPRLESAMDVIGSRVDSFNNVVAILASITAVSADLSNSLSAAGLKRAEDIEWYPGKGSSGSAYIDGKRAEGRRYCAQLSITMGVPLQGDIFGEDGYRGDSWAQPSFQYGGPIPLG